MPEHTTFCAVSLDMYQRWYPQMLLHQHASSWSVLCWRAAKLLTAVIAGCVQLHVEDGKNACKANGKPNLSSADFQDIFITASAGAKQLLSPTTSPTSNHPHVAFAKRCSSCSSLTLSAMIINMK